MLRAVVALMLVQAVVAMGAPVALALVLRRRHGTGYVLVLVGVGSMIGAQVVHLPLNLALGKVLPASLISIVWVQAGLAGLTAGLCEEVARWLTFRFWRSDARTGPGALMLGAGHGGSEAVVIGALAAVTAIGVLYAERVELASTALDAGAREAMREQLDTFHALDWWLPLLGAAERLFVLPFQIAASLTVCLAVVRRQPLFLLAAIAAHAALDAGVVYFMTTSGPFAAEGFLAATVPFSALTIVMVSRRLAVVAPAPPPRTRGISTGSPLEILGVTKLYPGDVRALDSATFTLREGERACLLGPNGAGKTTAIRLLTGAIAPSEGSAFLFGREPDEEGYIESRLRVGIVPQQPGMYEHMRVREYLAMVRDLYGRGDVEAALRSLGLEDVVDRPLAKLSGGMQRRAVLAAALLPEPEVLILDEPSAGLDPVVGRQVIDLLREVTRGRTTLLCTHNLAEAEELSESVIILRNGRVLVHEPIADLRAQMTPMLVLAATQGTAALRDALEALGHDAHVVDETVRVPTAEPQASAPALLRALLDAGIDVYECRAHVPSLEEIFLSIVEERSAVTEESAS